jgi:hypothetical protein
MPLLDHFHPPLSQRRTWEGFHGLWAAALVEMLNRDLLGEDYFADMQVHVGSQVEVEVDIATLDERTSAGGTESRATTVLAPSWSPPATSLVLPTVFPDEIEVQVFATVTGASLVAAIELVSPGNKDRPETRRAFAAKCASYLARGVGLVVVDIVTNRHANLHNEIVEMLGHSAPYLLPAAGAIYAVAYRPARRPAGDQIEMWPEALAVGASLPVLPLALRNAETIPLDLEAAYREACERSRLS